MTGAPGLHVLGSPDVADDLRADGSVADRLIFTEATGLRQSLAAARHAPIDVAVVRAGSPNARLLAFALRAVGVTVWWVDALRSSSFGIGAPVVVSTWPDVLEFERVAQTAARPGAGRDAVTPVSVVITALDEGAELDAVAAAVVAQLGVDDELVIIDGGSVDGSPQRVAATWSGDDRVVVQVHPGAGISVGRNAGVRTARHDVIVCTDAGCQLSEGWLDAMRRAFSSSGSGPGLVSGTVRTNTDSFLAAAQSYACYPDPREVHRPDAMTRVYTAIFGTGFDPAYAIGRNVAFTRSAWRYAGGFPEDLATGEDVSFGLAVSRRYACVGASDAEVGWRQRSRLGQTWRMYRSYGFASTSGGDLRLLKRDGSRALAYLGAAVACRTSAGRRVVVLGLIAYLSQPVRRARRDGARAAVFPLLPVALVTKDLGKVFGACEGAIRSRRGRRTPS